MILVTPDTDGARAAAHVVATLKDNGHEALWAGGCVRDILLERMPKDYDVATAAPAEQVLALFPGAQEVGKAFGVVRVPTPPGEWIEVATFREDASYTDGRRPDAVTFSDARHDAERRDFTVNAIFYDPIDQKLIDYADGLRDLQTGTIRCVGDAAKRFEEDHLRLLRALRFAATLEFSIEPATAAAIRSAASLIKHSYARSVVEEECLDLLQEAYEHNPVQFGENVRESVNFICNCCGCCCGGLESIRRGSSPLITVTSYLAQVDLEECNGCGTCFEKCQVSAIELVDEKSIINQDHCIGCGQCALNCSSDAIHMERTGLRKVFVPPVRVEIN